LIYPSDLKGRVPLYWQVFGGRDWQVSGE